MRQDNDIERNKETLTCDTGTNFVEDYLHACRRPRSSLIVHGTRYLHGALQISGFLVSPSRAREDAL